MSANYKESQNKEKNYRSRYDVNRTCYRKDKTHYVYMRWVEPDDGSEGYYVDQVFAVGDDGITLELLDYLQASDNGEVQDQEDDERLRKTITEYGNVYAKSAEDEMDAGEEAESPITKEFDEKVRPHLSDDQMHLVYDRFGMNKTLQQIADESPAKPDGTHVTHQAVTNKMNRIFAKVKKYMPEE